jgi:hypothetical protein
MSKSQRRVVPTDRTQWLRGIKPGDIVRVSSHALNLSDAGTHVGVGIVTSASRIIAIDRVKDVAVRYKFRRSDGLQHGEMGPHMGRIDPIPQSEVEGALKDWKFATKHALDKREASAERDARIKAATEETKKAGETLALARHRKRSKSTALTVDAMSTPSFLRLREGWTLPPHMLIMGDDGFVGCMRDGDEELTRYLTGVSYFASPVTECPNCSHKISIARLERQ